MNTIGHQGRHSIHLSYWLRLSRPVHLLNNHSPLAVPRELRLTCSISLQNAAEASLTEPLPRTLRQPLHFSARSCPRTREPRGRHRQLGTVNEDTDFQILHRRQDRWQPQVHEALLAATPSLLPPSSSSPCRRSTICTSRSSAIDPVQPLTAYAGTINEH